MADDERHAVFATYNIHKCIGTDRRFDPDRTAEVIAEIDADVIALQEADRRFGDRAGLLDLVAIEARTGLRAVAVETAYKGHGWRGNLILARGEPLGAVRQIALPGHEPRGALVVTLRLAAGAVRVAAAHLGLLRRARIRQVDLLVAGLRADGSQPLVLMGDLNEWRRRGRSSLNGLVPVFGTLRPGIPSFPAYRPVFALDRIFARPHDALGPLVVHDTPLARRASDHLPVKARLRLAPVAQDAGAGPAEEG